MSGIDEILLRVPHGQRMILGWNDPIKLSSWIPEPKEVFSRKDVADRMKDVLDNYSFDSFKSTTTTIIDTMVERIIQDDGYNDSKFMSFYTNYNKDGVIRYKPFKKYVSRPLLSCEYTLLLDVLKTA